MPVPESAGSRPKDTAGDVATVNACSSAVFGTTWPPSIFSMSPLFGVGVWRFLSSLMARGASCASVSSRCGLWWLWLELASDSLQAQAALLCWCLSPLQPFLLSLFFFPTGSGWDNNSQQKQLLLIRICPGILVSVALIWVTGPQ